MEIKGNWKPLEEPPVEYTKTTVKVKKVKLSL
jgi:hypothetical protein